MVEKYIGIWLGIKIFEVTPFEGSEEHHYEAGGLHAETLEEMYEMIEEYMGLPEQIAR